MKKFILNLIKYRYLVASVVFLISLSLDLHGSSIANWNNFGVSELRSGTISKTENHFGSTDKIDIGANLENWISLTPKNDGTLIGLPRMIRTDEWLVQTPYFVSQSETGNKFTNHTYGLEGQNMILSYNAPVNDISSIGKPFSWGFLFLGASKGLSWYWSFKMIGMLLLAFEFSMILTKKNLLLSVLGGFWITFTPTIQWWFMQHLGDVVFMSLLIMVSLYHYFHTTSHRKKLLFAGLLTSGLIGFPLIVYPAFQVPFAYLILAFFIIEFIDAFKRKQLKSFDWLVMIAVILMSGLIVGVTIYRSLDALKATLNTIYPGHRVSIGGEESLTSLSDFFLSFILPFKIPSFSNQVELATSLSFLIPCLVWIPLVLKKDKVNDNFFGIFMACYSLFLIFFAIVGLPRLITRLTLFSFVPGNRAWQSVAVIGVFVSLWFIAYFWREFKGGNRRLYFVLSALSLGSVLILVGLFYYNVHYLGYVGGNYLVIFALFYLFLLLAIIWSRKRLFAVLLLFLIALSGMTVNPLVKGLNVIEDKKLSIAIKKIVKKDGKSRWISEDSLYNFPQMFGAKTINSVRFYPDENLMNILDKEDNYEQYWNRYAHIRINIISSKTTMDNSSPDSLNIHLDDDSLAKLNVRYIISHRQLDNLFGSTFKKIYGPDKDGNMIYYYHY